MPRFPFYPSSFNPSAFNQFGGTFNWPRNSFETSHFRSLPVQPTSTSWSYGKNGPKLESKDDFFMVMKVTANKKSLDANKCMKFQKLCESFFNCLDSGDVDKVTIREIGDHGKTRFCFPGKSNTLFVDYIKRDEQTPKFVFKVRA